MHRSYLASVIAMVPKHRIQKISRLTVEQIQSLANVRIYMPSQQHRLVEAVDAKEILTFDELEIARSVKSNEMSAGHDFIEMSDLRPLANRIDRAQGISPIEYFPESFGDFESREMIESLGKIPHKSRQRRPLVGNEDHIGVGGEDPAVSWVGSPDS